MKYALSVIGVENVTIKVNHRGILNEFLETIGLREKSEDILRTIDKLAKIGEEKVTAELIALMEGDSEAESKKDKIMSFISAKEDFDSTLENMSNLAGEKALPHVERMKEIRNMMKAAGIEKSFVLDPAITRGLDYYTGVVYETFLNDLPSIGSVCSGGRYDNLAGLYMKDRIPGVGSSIGLDRLIAGLELLGASNKKGSFLDCEIFCLDKTLSVHYQGIASKLREQGISVEVFADEKKIGQQYTVAEKKGIPFGIMIKAEDAEKNVLTLKNLLTREQFTDISVEEAGKIILESKKLRKA